MESVRKREPVRVNPVLRHPQEQFIVLDDQWRFCLDPADEGIKGSWFSDPSRFSDGITVPGCWQGQGFGRTDEEDEVWDFRMKARVFKATWHGTGWYGRSLRIPPAWKGRRVWLKFGGAHPSADVWLNGRLLGSHSGPFVPFAFDITGLLPAGSEGFLAVRVHEKDRWLGLAYSWQGHWSGLYRNVELAATGASFLENCWLHPDLAGKALRCRGWLGELVEEGTVTMTVCGPDGAEVAGERFDIRNAREFSCRLPVPSVRPWSPDSPALYRADITVAAGDLQDAVSERVGFVSLSAKDRQFLINGEPYYMFGTGDFSVSPETGSPDTDRDRWRRKLKTLREYGYNYVRCQSYAPPPEYFDAADEVGLLIQTEMGMMGAWGGSTQYHMYQWPQPHTRYRAPLRHQWNRTVMRDVNHPSANLYCMSNEYGHTPLTPETAWRCYRETREIKPTALVIWTDGAVDKAGKKLPLDFYCAEAPEAKKCRTAFIQHEYRWWTSFPDVRNRAKYDGAIRPYVLDATEAVAARHGATGLLPQLAANSQKLQFVEAKLKMEEVRRDNPMLAGISHFTAMDIGFSPQGVVNEFYGRKLVSGATWQQTSGQAVLLLENRFDDRILTSRDMLERKVFISDFGRPPLKNPVLQWRFADDHGKTIDSGSIRFNHRPFCTHPAGTLRCTLPEVAAPFHATLTITAQEDGRTCANAWDFWVFPARTALPETARTCGRMRSWLKGAGMPAAKLRELKTPGSGVLVTEVFDARVREYVEEGGRVLLVAPEGITKPSFGKLGCAEGRYFRTCPANYPTYEDGNTGTIVNRHPMLGDFPHEGFCDLQFYRMVGESAPVEFHAFEPLKGEPVIRSFSTCFIWYQLSYLMEFALGKGGLIITSLNLDQKLPEARHLFSRILTYAGGSEFAPKTVMPEQGVRVLLEEASGKDDVFA
jgi:beta-galactosidase